MLYSVGELVGTLRILGAAQAARDLGAVSDRFATAGDAAGSAAAEFARSDAALVGAGRAASVASQGSARLRAQQLQTVAATERFNTLLADENVSLGRLASAEASVIRNQARLTEMQTQTARSTAVMNDEMAATPGLMARGASGFLSAGRAALGMGAAFGAFEVAKQAIDITKQASAYQQQMTMIRNLTSTSTEDVRALNTVLLGMAGRVAQAPEDLATSAYHAESALRKLGATAPDIYKTVETAAKGASIGNTDLEDTTNALTATMASGIVSYNQANKAMGALLSIVGAGDMKMSDLNDALSTGLLVNMRVFGVSLKDTGAALAVFGDNNIRGAQAATKLRMSVQDLAKPAATAGPVLQQIGLTVDDLRNRLQNHGLNGALDLLKQKLNAAGVTGSKIGPFLLDAFTKRAGAGLAILLTRLDQFHEAQAQIEKGANSFGAEWSAVTKTVGFQFHALGAQIDAAGIKLMQNAQPALARVAGLLSGGLHVGLQMVGDALHPFVTGWHDVSAVLGPVGHALGDVARFLAPVAPVLKDVGSAALTMWVAFKGYQLARDAVYGVMDASAQMAVRVKNNASEMAASMGLASRNAASDAEIMQRDLLAVARADMDAAAQIQQAEADKATAFFNARNASETASASEIAAARANMEARQAEADAAAAQAAEIGAAADTAAADVDAAGEAAAAGWSGLLGPLALVGIGVAMFTSLLGRNNDQAQANKQIMQGYADSLKQSSDALAAVNTKQTVKNLQDQHSFALLAQVNAGQKQYTIGAADLILAVNGQVGAYRRLESQLHDIADAQKYYTSDQQGTLTPHYYATGRAALTLAHNITTLRNNMTAAEKEQALATKVQREAQIVANGGANATARQARALGMSRNAYLTAQAAAQQNTAQTRAQTQAFQIEGDAASLLSQALNGLAGRHLALAQAATTLDSANLQVISSLKASKGSLDDNTQAGNAARQAIQSQITALISYAGIVGKQQHSTDAANEALATQKQRLLDDLAAHNLLTPAIRQYINELASTKRFQDYLNAHPFQPKINPSPAINAIDQIHTKIMGLVDGSYNVVIGVNDPGGYRRGNTAVGRAAGGGLPEGVSAVGERGPELVVKHGPVVHVLSNPQSKKFLALTGMRAPGFARGTGSLFALASQFHDWDPRVMAAIAMAESGGNAHAHNYNLGTGDDSYGLWQINMLGAMGPARRREFGIRSDSALYNPETNVRAAHDIWRGSGYGAWTTFTSGAYRQFLGEGGRYRGGTGGTGGTGGGGSSAARQAAQARRQAVHQLPGDVRNLIHSLSSPSTERSALGQLLPDVRAAGYAQDIPHLHDLNQHVVDAIRRLNESTNDLKSARSRLHSLIQAMKQESGAVRQAAASGFDITTAGQNAAGRFSLGRFRAQETQYKNLLQRWVRDFHKITPLFKKTATGRAMLARLASEDPTQGIGELDALADASPKMLRSIIAEQAAEAKIEKDLGRYISRAVYGDRVQHERVVVRRDERQVREDRRHLDHEVNRIIHVLEHLHLGVTFDSAGAARAHARGDKKRHRRRNVRAQAS